MTISPISDFSPKCIYYIIFLLAPNRFNLSLLIIIIFWYSITRLNYKYHGNRIFNIVMSCLVFLKNARTQLYISRWKWCVVHNDVWFPSGNFTLSIVLLNYCWKKFQHLVFIICLISESYGSFAPQALNQRGMSTWVRPSNSLIWKVDFCLCAPPFL